MTKKEALEAMGCLNRGAEQVSCALFRGGGAFFDACDKVQVKYEMLRGVAVEGLSVTDAADAFGYSRQSYYSVARDFELEGCVGLLDQAQGRRQPEKLSREVVGHILAERDKDAKGNSGYRLADKVWEQFGIRIHPRTVYKVLKKRALQEPAAQVVRRPKRS